MGKCIKTIEIEVLKSGQVRPYGDAIYEAIYTFKIEPENSAPLSPSESTVLKYIQADYLDPFKKIGEDYEWHEDRMEKLEKLDTGKWRVIIKSPYLD